jgi:alkylation response protein AidB-like acyl-CoA dehydrogenase
MQVATETKLFKGGDFLISETSAHDVFVPEEFTEEQRAIEKMCIDFVQTEVAPHFDEIDSMKDPKLMPSLMDKAGAQGLLGISMPEQYGGFGQDFNTVMLTTEALGAAYSFSVAFSAHTGIGTLPILYFGTEEQKNKYLPKLSSGEWKAAYCLTEPGSGSDALGARTKATLTPDGKHYLITGQKMWITNGGFADLFIVFAKIDGDKFTGFIVERTWEGISMNEEEKKMGIKGSSTRQIFFNDVKVPVENLLGEIGKGHRIAFNILNIGRIKLSAATLGGAKQVANLAVKYANERHQFNRAISSFGAIQHKLADMAIWAYSNESGNYRASDAIARAEHANVAAGKNYSDALLGAAQEFAAECSILKVHGSECLDFIVDEGVQIYGGYGFSAEYPMDRAYRDSRINRIYEGTNEINRMLCVSYLLGKAMKGELPIMQAAMAVQKELTSVPDMSTPDASELFGNEKRSIQGFKKAILMVAGAAAQKYMQALENEQEIMMALADMIIQTYMAESTLLRVEKLATTRGREAMAEQIDIVRVLVHDAADKIHTSGKEAINAMADGDMQRMMLMGLKRFAKAEPINTVAARRRIAAKMIEANGYPY